MQTVSIIIPTYNRWEFLEVAIKSVFTQTYQDYELIIIDDGSTDVTSEHILRYSDRLKYFYQENKGPSAARNAGIRIATGEFISFLDSDDRWLPKKLKIQMDFIAKNPETKICYTNEIWIRRGKRVNQKNVHQKYSGWIFQHCLPLCIVSPSSVIIQREVFEKIGLFDEQLIVCEDYDFWLRASLKYPFAFIDQPLIVKFGGHADQLSHRFWGMDRFRVMALEKILSQDNLTKENREATIQALEEKCTILANGSIKRGNSQQSDYYWKIIQRYKTLNK
jgi:glycosyltransferase involved in cell wall biosynthesis